MKALLSEIKIAVLVTLAFAFLLCGVYPLVVWGAGQALFPDKANGSLIIDHDGTVRGSTLLAQNFASAKYFQPRPSAAGPGYDATSSSGTNLGPTSQKLADTIRAAAAAYRTANELSADTPVPADAVTCSGSGLDPHIRIANAELQAVRVAKARHIPVEQVRNFIVRCTADRSLGIFGEPGVNVLELNRTLDATRGATPMSQRRSGRRAGGPDGP